MSISENPQIFANKPHSTDSNQNYHYQAVYVVSDPNPPAGSWYCEHNFLQYLPSRLNDLLDFLPGKDDLFYYLLSAKQVLLYIANILDFFHMVLYNYLLAGCLKLYRQIITRVKIQLILIRYISFYLL